MATTSHSECELAQSRSQKLKVLAQRKEYRRKRSCEIFAIGEKAEGRTGEPGRYKFEC
jgi:hypothetical protein